MVSGLSPKRITSGTRSAKMKARPKLKLKKVMVNGHLYNVKVDKRGIAHGPSFKRSTGRRKR